MSGLRPGEIVLEDASRAFSVRADQGRTLKGLLIGRRGRGAGPRPVQAMDGVSLRIAPGETVGVVGRNGAGKSSTLKALAGIVPLDRGRADCGGRVVSLLDLGAGFGRDFSGRENILLQGALHGFTREQIEARMDDIVAFSELGDFVDVPVKTYSAGMFVRLGFSIAAHLDADVLLIDEVLAVGDEAFQRKCLRRIAEHIERGATLVLVSHDPGAIERVCRRVVVLDGGRVLFDGPTAEGLLAYHRLLGVEHEADAPAPAALAEGGVAVGEVELRDGAGRRATAIGTGDALAVAAALAGPPGGRARVTLEVRAAGRPVFRGAGEVPLGPDGRARATYAVERVTLLGGEYDVLVGADEADRPGAEGVPPGARVAKLVVHDDAEATGVADLRGTWSAVAVGDAAPEPVR